MKDNPTRLGATAPEAMHRKHSPARRRLLSGRLVPRAFEGVRPFTAPMPYTRQPGAGAQRAAVLFAAVPEPTRVVVEVAAPVPGQPRRRDRRAAARANRTDVAA